MLAPLLSAPPCFKAGLQGHHPQAPPAGSHCSFPEPSLLRAPVVIPGKGMGEARMGGWEAGWSLADQKLNAGASLVPGPQACSPIKQDLNRRARKGSARQGT